VLRVDDTDAARSDAALEAAIMADLRWLGIEWDEGPDVGGSAGPYRQRERLDRYRAAAGSLVESGRAYRCFCPEERLEELRREALAAGRTPRYDRRCLGLPPDEAQRRIAAGEPAAIRFRVPQGEVVIDDLIRGRVTIGHDALSDPIIVRSDGVAGYNFASVVDDLAMGITHVIRGDDHLTNTARQQLLFEALGGPVPRFAHHAMVLGPDGGKLSKRHGAAAVGDYRRLGYLPQAIVNYLALLGWSHGEDEVLGMERLVAEFEPDELSSSPAVFDLPKLDWLDHEHIMALPPEEHERLFAEWLPAATPPPAVASLAAAFQPSLVRYGEAPALAAAVLEPPALQPEPADALGASAAPLTHVRALRANAPEWLTPAAARELLAAYRAWGKEQGIGARDLLMPLRIALTAVEHGPELPFVLGALARDDTLERLDLALSGSAAGGPTTTPGD